MDKWKGTLDKRQVGRPKGQLNHRTRLSKQIDAVLNGSSLQFIQQFVQKALEGSPMHEKLYWEELTKRDSPLLQLLVQNNVGPAVPGLVVNFMPSATIEPERPVVTIDATLEPDQTNVVALPRQTFIRSRPLKSA